MSTEKAPESTPEQAAAPIEDTAQTAADTEQADGMQQRPQAAAREQAQAPASDSTDVDLRQWRKASEEAAQAEQTMASTAVRAGGRAHKLFQSLSCAAPLVLLVVLAAQVWPELWQGWNGTALYCPPEAAQIQVYQSTVQGGDALVPGAHLPAGMVAAHAQWPAYQWLALALGEVLPVNMVFPVASALAAALALLAVWGLSRAAGLGRDAAFAGGLVLLCTPSFIPLAHFTGPVALASALAVVALLCFVRGWQAEKAALSLSLGFVATALAGLAGGLLFLALPLVSSVCFLIWRGTYRRGQSGDAITGFVLFLLVLALWYGSIVLLTDATVYSQGLAASLTAWRLPVAGAWWKPLALALAGLIPWVLLPLCVTWPRILREAWPDLKASRKEKAGVAFLWIALLVLLGMGIFVPEEQTAALAGLLACVAAPLAGKALLRLSALGSRVYFLIIALLLLHAGIFMAAAGFGLTLDWLTGLLSVQLSADQRALVLSLSAVPVLGVLCLLAAILMTRFVRRGAPAGSLLISALLVVVLAQFCLLMLAPSLATVPQARLVRLEQVPMPLDLPAATDAAQPAPLAPAEVPETPAVPEKDSAEGTQAPASQQVTPAEAQAPAVTALPAGEAAAPEAAPQTAPQTVPQAAEDVNKEAAKPAASAPSAVATPAPAEPAEPVAPAEPDVPAEGGQNMLPLAAVKAAP